MKNIATEIEKHFLFPSTIFVDRNRYQVTTILGSCVSVCLYDKRVKIGGVNHYMLPLWNGSGLASPKFGNIAIEKLIEKVISLGGNKKFLVAKVFGGANQTNASYDIGNRNIKVAISTLETHKIPLVAKSVGGHIGRKIIFDTYTGEVLMKFVKES